MPVEYYGLPVFYKLPRVFLQLDMKLEPAGIGRKTTARWRDRGQKNFKFSIERSCTPAEFQYLRP